ncbi:anti-phage dCTP deaminase [Pelagibacterium lentulum]|uniref:Deoxycytidylate deaminase n=1 Tax=Pelagibacterium lentulum TaxID=2029865 RepID=A0A916RAM4_9HYPH|nr:anti-phage dCTP deaminase [Pelagibacterium lentulum]GGA42043.1 deoxycytidylate deaminase [Pelagibacterium lentulum]
MLKIIDFPEIFVGLVAPVGVDLQPTKNALVASFEAKGYQAAIIKVTEAFPFLNSHLKSETHLDNSNYHSRVESYIRFGNEVRRLFKKDEILAASSVFSIVRARRRHIKEARLKEPSDIYAKRVFIIDQLKRPEEVDLLRRVYGDLFLQVSVYARRETRAKYIAQQVEKQLATRDGQTPESMALELIAKDENEASSDHGQRVAKTFHGADFIVNTEVTSASAKDQVARLVEIVFGANDISPTKQEYGMNTAKTAALRTLDLSRQVGAAIFTRAGEILSLGSNEVPKAGGGTYWCDEPGIDAREYTWEGDTNDELKNTVARQFFEIVASTFDVSEEFDTFVRRKEVKEARLLDALEYGRIVHAEMSALMDAARTGSSVKNTVLYTTTFPCHMCAKHIVASGVGKVVYLEPYPKSLVPLLHIDSVEIDGSDRGKYRKYPSVKFEHFFGVTPRRYRPFFERAKRKDGASRFVRYIDGKVRPIFTIYRPFYIELERNVIEVGLAELNALAKEENGTSPRLLVSPAKSDLPARNDPHP